LVHPFLSVPLLVKIALKQGVFAYDCKRPPPAFEVNSTSCILIAPMETCSYPRAFASISPFLTYRTHVFGRSKSLFSHNDEETRMFSLDSEHATISLLGVTELITKPKTAAEIQHSISCKARALSLNSTVAVSRAVKALRGTPTPASILHFSSRGSTTPPHSERHRILQISLARNKELDWRSIV
jgi:hypothetical protein